MKKVALLFLTLIATVVSAQDAKQLVSEAIEAHGGKDNFYNLGNVNYDYEYRTPDNSLYFKGHETYVFDGELSHASFEEHSVLEKNGKVIEGFDGTNAWASFDGVVSDDKDANGFARFLRKTNYYWFTMFFKLLDDGVNYESIGAQEVNGKAYDRVKITFGEDVGDASDIYVLYINKETKLIDQFLFTVMSFNLKDPKLMTYEYETIDGIVIGSKRKYIDADWDGNIVGKEYTTTDWTNIKFNTEIDKALFQKPMK